MPETALQPAPPTPLTTLTEDEILFRDNIRQFADERLRPLVKEMDDKGIFSKDLIHEFFQLGLMGIEIRSNTAVAAPNSLKRSWRWKNCRASMHPPVWWSTYKTHWLTMPCCVGAMLSRKNGICRRWRPTRSAPMP